MPTSHRRRANESSGNEAPPSPEDLQPFVSDDPTVSDIIKHGSYGSEYDITQLGFGRSTVQMPQNQGMDDDHDEDEDEEEDQPPVWTSRVMVLGSISYFSLLIINKFIVKKTSECMIAMASTVIILYVLGYFMSKLVPKRRVYFPTLGLEFSLNPGPFHLREYAMICVIANLGGTYGGITSYSVDWSDG